MSGAMNTWVMPERQAGAARLSVFFALWTLALLLVHDVRVNAAPIYDVTSAGAQSGWLATPAPLPQVDTTSMWDALAQRSDVISGRWSSVVQSHAKSVHTAFRPTNDRAEAQTVAADQAQPAAAPIAVKNASNVAVAEALVARRIAARDFAGAIETIEQARVDNPNAAPQLRLLDAHVAIGEGDFERAYSILLEALPDIQVSTRQHDLLAAVMLRTARFPEAATIYRALLTMDPSNARWWAGYAVTQEKLGNRAELTAAFRTLRTLVPPGTPLAVWAGERLQRIG
jgi:hypothetical protein